MAGDFIPRTLDGDPDIGVLSLQVGGRRLAAEDRDRLIAEVRAGAGPTRLNVEALVFLQRDTPNRNFVRFKKSTLGKLAKSFVGRPVLRDHETGDLSAVAGRILASELIEHKGVPAIAQTLELVKPWAIEAALDGTMSTFSIGFGMSADGDVVCSECSAPLVATIFGAASSCSHFPGDKLGGKDGEPSRYVEMMFTGAEGFETSAVTIPAVTGTHVAEIRSALAAERARARIAHHQEKPMLKLCTMLALSADASEDAILAAVGKIQLDARAVTALHAAELEAHNATKARLATLDGELAIVRKADRDKTLATLRDAVERKVGKGDAGKPVMDVVLQLAEVSLEQAQNFVTKLATVLPIGQPLLSRGTEAETPAGQLTAQQKKIARSLGQTDADYLKTLQAEREKEVA